MKISKVVLIVVALHVLVIGGIFVFEGCSRTKTTPPEMAENETPAAPEGANAPAVPATDNLTPAVPSPAPAPAAAPASAAAPAPVVKTYTVKKGDSLWKIAKTEGVSIGDLARANNLNKTTALKVGQKLQIPAKTEPVVTTASVAPVSAAEAFAPASAAVPMDGNVYIVKTGDSLWKIARAQNVTVAALKQANHLTSDSLKIGQKLQIPAPSASAASTQAGVAGAGHTEWQPGPVTENGQQYHIVDIGETPAVIAKHYGISVAELMKANNITDAKRIWVGQKLVIPAAPASPAATTAAPAATTAAPAAPTATAPAAAATAPVAAPIVSSKN
jgi:LysM repeat protein